MKAVKRMVYATLTIISLVMIMCEADTAFNQIIWSGSWMFVCGLSAKRFEKCLDKEEGEERV